MRCSARSTTSQQQCGLKQSQAIAADKGVRLVAFYFISVAAFTLCGIIAAGLSRPLVPELGFASGGTLGVLTGVVTGGIISPAIHRKPFVLASLVVFGPALGAAVAWVILLRGSAAPELAAIACAATAAFMSGLARLILPDVAVFPASACQFCGYDLRGSKGGVCPECGKARLTPPGADEPWKA